MKKTIFLCTFFTALMFVSSVSLMAGKSEEKKAESKDKEGKGKKGKEKKPDDTVMFVLDSNQPTSGGYLTIIRDTAGTTYIPIYIGDAEGQAIDRAIARQRPPRPLTHDLIASIITELGGEVKYLTIVDLKNNTYIGTLTIKQGKKTHEIDCRPSDGLAIAMRMAADIKVAQKVIQAAGLSEQEMIQQGYPVKSKSKFPTKSF
jgi:bifunctional DNase/RNase